MRKNIIITGAARTGKTTLAVALAKKLNLSLISLDNIVSALSAYPGLDIHHDGDMEAVSEKLAPFIKIFLKETAKGKAFCAGTNYVIEGTYFDLDQIIPFLSNSIYRDSYEIIGLTFGNKSEDELFDIIKTNDTCDDWTYWCDDNELAGNVRYFIERNDYFKEKFEKYNIKTFDTVSDRNKAFDSIISYIITEANEKRP